MWILPSSTPATCVSKYHSSAQNIHSTCRSAQLWLSGTSTLNSFPTYDEKDSYGCSSRCSFAHRYICNEHNTPPPARRRQDSDSVACRPRGFDACVRRRRHAARSRLPCRHNAACHRPCGAIRRCRQRPPRRPARRVLRHHRACHSLLAWRLRSRTPARQPFATAVAARPEVAHRLFRHLGAACPAGIARNREHPRQYVQAHGPWPRR